MKKYLAALSTTALISVAPFALAASSTDLTVTGTITPSSCTPSLSAGGIVDIGKIAAKDLNPSTATLVNTTRMELTVACDAPTLFALNAVDNRANTSFNTHGYGLGLTDADEKLGAFAPYILSVEADGVASGAIDSIDAGTTWRRATYMLPGRLTSTSDAGDLIPIFVENLLMSLDVRTWIARTDSLTLTDEVTLDGSATFEMKYL